MPDYSDFFGTADYCACGHCRSVLGPAAYLADLLQWLHERPTKASSSTSLRDRLLGTYATGSFTGGRRRDLAYLALSCENADRALPYIDLVLEVLENAVDNSGTVTDAAAHDSEAETSAMLAAPQHVSTTAYTTLASATTCLELPFNRPLEEARTFLQHLGVPRSALLDSFRPLVGSATLSAELHREVLGLSSASYTEVCRGATTEILEDSYWPVLLYTATPGSWLTRISEVRTFRRASRLEWPEIQDLVHARYVNPRTWSAPQYVPEFEVFITGDVCDLTTYSLSPYGSTSAGTLTLAQVARLRQFIRLHRATGWPIPTLDKVLTALGVTSTSTSTTWLRAVAQVRRIERLCDEDAVSIACWRATEMDTWDDRDTRESPTPSLYARVYLNPAVLPADHESRADWELEVNPTTGAGPELAGATKEVWDNRGLIAGALGLTGDALDALLARLEWTDISNEALSLENLTTLFKWASIGRACHMSPADAHWLATSASLAPTVNADNDHALDLVKLARFFETQGWSIDEVRYAVDETGDERAAVTDAFLQTALGRVRDGLRSAYDALAADTDEASLRELVGKLVAEELGVDRATIDSLRRLSWTSDPLLTPTSTDFTFAKDTSVTLVDTQTLSLPIGWTGTISISGTPTQVWLTTSAQDVTLTAGTVISIAQGETWTGNAPTAADIASGTAFILPKSTTAVPITVQLPNGTTYVTGSGTTGTLTSATACAPAVETAGLTTAAITVSFAFEQFSFQNAPGEPDFLAWLLREPFRAAATTASGEPWSDLVRGVTHDTHFAILDALAKICFVLRKLGLEEDERDYWITSGPTAWGMVAPTSLDPAAAAVAVTSIEDLVRLFGCRARLPGETPSFVAVLQAAVTTAGSSAATDAAEALSDALAERADWSAEDLSALVEDMRADSDLGSLDTADGLWTFLDRAEAVRRLGASAATVLTWTGLDTVITTLVSSGIVVAASSRTPDEAAWASIARPIRDVLRKRQRDALVAWLLARSGQTAAHGTALEDAEALYQYYLIDVSMNPEMLTSRLKQAACSVQLFMHRVALGIELNTAGTDVLAELNDDDRKQWDWMRTYRVWEAARKVFLYPENWIEPELRTDASPFFRAMQSELAQGDLNEDRVTDDVLGYLERLRHIARMEVVAYYHETETVTDSESVDRLHVFARTRSNPPEYHYACRESSGIWTAWEKLDCGVEGAHLFPTVYERRLLLFWLAFDPKSDGTSEDSGSGWHDIRYVWTERRGKTWTKSQTVPLATDQGRALQTANPASVSGEFYFSYVNHLLLRLGDRDGWVTASPLPVGAEVRNDKGDWTFSRPLQADFDPIAPNLVHQGEGPLEINYWEDDASPSSANVAEWPSVDILTSPDTTSNIMVVLGHQAQFHSQRPFFLTWGTRAWLVEQSEPGALTEDVEQSDAANEGTSVTPPSEPEEVSAETGNLASSTYYADASDALLALETVEANFSATEADEAPATGAPYYKFTKLYHPHDGLFLSAVRRNGLFALLAPDPDGPEAELVLQDAVGTFDFAAKLDPTDAVLEPYPTEDITFDASAPYALYNWELFVHLPFYVANQLMVAGRYEEAMEWFHCIFDPRVPGSNGWWRVAPLAEATMTAATDWFTFMGEEDSEERASFENQVSAWRDDPFDPHLVAMLRPGAYAKAVFMRYLDNLLAWGDQLFTRDTIESNNEATQLYVMVKQLLGERPEELEPATAPESMTYLELLDDGVFDAFGNVSLENYIVDGGSSGTADAYAPEVAVLSSTAAVSYFCVPNNDRLLSYWDTTDDRLFKLRNGMNIAGVVRSLPLYEPPIDPALLVRASAAGVDIGTVLDDLAAGVPNYRFNVMLGRAQSLTASVKALCAALLTALEKKDAESLSILRGEQESAMQELVLAVRVSQVEEAERGLDAARKSKALVQGKLKYFERLLDKGLNAEENSAATHTSNADALQLVSGVYALMGTWLGAIPDIYVGLNAGVKTGGEMFSRIVGGFSEAYGLGASAERAIAGRLTTTAGYKRREEGWKHERKQASIEVDQVEAQLKAATVRLEIARREHRNQERQLEHSAQVLEFMRSKWTNEELYQWSSAQLATLAFQSYQLALATAKKAERAYQHESGRTDDTFISAVYWDSLRKGLLAGERLSADLERMDAAYLEQDSREHELTKHVSLSRLDPLALARLREEGECYFSIPEEHFDLDSPGHYFRRIQSVALSIAAATGQQSTVNAQLTLHATRLRRTTTATAADQETFTDYPSIVTSVATQDAGLFQADLKDARYLPFERRGAVSQWHLKLTAQVIRQIEWESIADVTLHLRYTARDGGAAFAAKRESALQLTALDFGYTTLSDAAKGEGAVFMLSAARDAPDALYAAQQASATVLSLELEVTETMLGALVGESLARIFVIPVGTSLTSPEVTVGATTTGLTSAQIGTLTYWWADLTNAPDSTYTIAADATTASLDDVILILALT